MAVLGGGQLGRMLGVAGIPLALRFRFLDPGSTPPAGAVGPVVTGALDDRTAIDRVVEGAVVVTYEWEGVPADAARHAAETAPVHPSPRALEVSQDRVTEKETCRALGIEVADFAAVDDRAGLDAAIEAVGLPSVLKTRRGGYDGKGQHVLRAPRDADAAWEGLGGVPLILEALVPFDRELSVLAARGVDGETACYPLVENRHVDGILRMSRAPAPATAPDLQAEGERIARRLLDELDYVGVLAVELFEHGGRLLANELAPRVHNSGHWTIEGADTSQFEQHLRAVLGRPLGSADARGPSAMVNCIGAMPDRDAVLAVAGAHLHDYDKAARPGRKVGHVTVTAADDEELIRRLDTLRAAAPDLFPA
ncbi:MAG TPA: 5-(carboxyamino)imidazole ribonucleotide synthase [Acidimicrobiia bacterium]|nr:5-(carboxyamino)imidazole ribonucleotide synthase [Acidimicrobiia bacterium]